MFRRFSVNYTIFSIFLDAVVIGVSLPIANYLRPKLNPLPFVAIVFKNEIPPILYPSFILTWISIMLLLSVYDSRRNFRLLEELTSVTLASILAGVSLAGVLYLTYREISRVLFMLYFLIAWLLLVSWRVIARLIRYQIIKTTNLQHRVLIIGAGQIGQNIYRHIQQSAEPSIYLVGFLDDDQTKFSENRLILGNTNQVRQIVDDKQVTDIIITLPRHAYKRINELVATLHDLPVKVFIVPDYFNLALHKATIEEFAGIPMMDLRAPALSEYQRLVKRIFDLVVGTIIQIFVAPVMIIIALAIKLDSKGPILFKQLRVGENGKLFWMYKFRSMVADAEQRIDEVIEYDNEGHIIHKKKEDPRVTRVGKIIRRTSLDELPQLFNVLKGEMSLVGPRPELPMLVEKYEPWQRKRFAVPQGITGWWQVNGRSDKPMHLHTEDDLYYVQNYSLFLDLKILIKTVLVVLRGRGAY